MVKEFNAIIEKGDDGFNYNSIKNQSAHKIQRVLIKNTYCKFLGIP